MPHHKVPPRNQAMGSRVGNNQSADREHALERVTNGDACSMTTIAVLATKPLWYFRETLPRIAKYAAIHGLGLYVERRDATAGLGIHPSWGKLLLCRDAPPIDQPIILWDADLVPMWHAPNIAEHVAAAPDKLAAVWYGEFRQSYRRRYPQYRKMGWNCGLLYVPARLRIPLAGLFGYFRHEFWEQGAINDFILRTGEQVTKLDGRWSRWVGRPTERDIHETWGLHFAHGGRRNANVGQLCKLLRLSGTRW